MSTIVRLAVRPDEDAKVTPVEVLRDFSDATRGWVFLEEDSQHYTKIKDASSVVIRRRIEPGTYVDLAFTRSGAEREAMELAVLDPPASDVDLSGRERKAVIEAFLDEIQDYLDTRPDHVTLHVDQQPDRETSL